MKKSKMLALVMIVVLAISCFVGCGDDKSNDSEDLKHQEENNEIDFSNVAVGEYIKFGKYEQDNDESNGKEDIEWLVLDKQDNKVLVVSKYALDCKPYNEEKESITWEKCTLRTWLNNDFMDNAFSEAEKAMVSTVTVVNDDNQKYDTDGGNDTQDKVFLLSIDEVNKYFDQNENGTCDATDYAKAQGVYIGYEYTESGEVTCCFWWLRSPGRYQYNAARYGFGIGLDEFGSNVHHDDDDGVRPALWINIK